MNACPLCLSLQVTQLPEPNHGGREFWVCQGCGLHFVPKAFHLSETAEKARYETHQNFPDDPAYRNFFKPFVEALTPHLTPKSLGLDFGAGPGPALAAMLREKGFSVALYDKYFHPDETVLEKDYAFITCTETAEHFREPFEEFKRFQKLLLPGGWLGILTGSLPKGKTFQEWHYPKDPTHIVFYEAKTMQWIAHHFGWISSFPAPNVTLFQKPFPS